jgi:hypothetical protein
VAAAGIDADSTSAVCLACQDSRESNLRAPFITSWPGTTGARRFFICGADYRLFLKTLGDVCQKTGWRVHAWAFIGNHRGLQSPQAKPVAGMSWLQNIYTRRLNRRHGLWGASLWKSLQGGRVVENTQWGGGDCLRSLLDYVPPGTGGTGESGAWPRDSRIPVDKPEHGLRGATAQARSLAGWKPPPDSPWPEKLTSRVASWRPVEIHHSDLLNASFGSPFFPFASIAHDRFRIFPA